MDDVGLLQQERQYGLDEVVDLHAALRTAGDVHGGQSGIMSGPLHRLDRGSRVTVEQL
ncbi:MAG: hypothetical protein ACRDSL_08240 [Pseudonocardiaceae bacterium]